VSIAMELLSRPTVLFLDEATSGLDLGTEAQMMKLFRDLADGGVTTMCITHYVDSLEQCDMVAYFVKGRLAYFGPPSELKAYFGVNAIRDLYVKETERTPEEWEAAFRQSDAYREYVEGRAQPTAEIEATMVRPGQGMEAVRPANLKRQFRVLTRRYVQVLLGDRRNLLLALCLAPIIALLVSFVLSGHRGEVTIGTETFRKVVTQQGQMAFVMTLVMIFLGIFGAIREIVKELPVYRHERFINLEILPYLASKALPLAILGFVQVLELLIVLHLFTDMRPPLVFWGQLFLLVPVIVAAMLLGLAISAAVDTADKAVMLMILVIIPQLLFANAFIRLEGFFGKLIAKVFILAYWAYDGLTALLPDSIVQAQRRDPNFFLLDWFMVVLFAAAYAGLAYFFMRRKDGPYGKPFHIPLVKSGAAVVFRTRLGWAFRKALDGGAKGIRAIRKLFGSMGGGGSPPPAAPPPMPPPPPAR
jgi:hypothetical protein